jgi:polysaccharide export outer membrane protein
MHFKIFTVIFAALAIGRFCFSAEPDSDRGSSAEKGAASEGQGSISQLDYVLQPSDLIRIVIFQEPDLEREVRMSAEGKISLPLVSEVDLKGKTIAQAQRIIHDLYDRDFLVNPQINLTVLEYNKVDVLVLGAVNSPGPITLPPDRPLNLLDAVARAGSFNRLADRKRVRLTRETEDHKTIARTINADDLMQSNSSNQEILQKGDVIYVPERIL